MQLQILTKGLEEVAFFLKMLTLVKIFPIDFRQLPVYQISDYHRLLQY